MKNKLAEEIFNAQNWLIILFSCFLIMGVLYERKSREVERWESLYRSLDPGLQRAIQSQAELRQHWYP